MVEIGYAISSEEHRPNVIVRHARMVEEAGCTFSSTHRRTVLPSPTRLFDSP